MSSRHVSSYPYLSPLQPGRRARRRGWTPSVAVLVAVLAVVAAAVAGELGGRLAGALAAVVVVLVAGLMTVVAARRDRRRLVR
jgi:hypothetical protein